MESEILLSAQNISHSFYLSKTASVRALDKLSFEIRRGEIYGLVGESGSGKSTAARCVMNLVKPQSGHIFYQGIDITDPRQFAANKKLLQTSRQMIFQDSTSSLNGRMKVADIIAEPMRIAHIAPKRGTYRKEAAFQMKYVGLDEIYLDKYPAELSGGQRQRVAIARALGRRAGRVAGRVHSGADREPVPSPAGRARLLVFIHRARSIHGTLSLRPRGRSAARKARGGSAVP